MDYTIFRTSGELDKLFAALAEAQKEIGGALKDKKNPHFGSNYATLASVWDTWQEVGPKNGLALVQSVLDADRFSDTAGPEPIGISHKERQGICLATLLGHKSGQYINAVSFFPANKKDPQIYVAAVTYARRATLAAMVGIAPEDDDGNTAAGKSGPSTVRSGQDIKAFAEQLKQGVEKFAKDAAKLHLLRKEADKIGAEDVIASIDAKLKELAV
jgi:hypothetical protein